MSDLIKPLADLQLQTPPRTRPPPLASTPSSLKANATPFTFKPTAPTFSPTKDSDSQSSGIKSSLSGAVSAQEFVPRSHVQTPTQATPLDSFYDPTSPLGTHHFTAPLDYGGLLQLDHIRNPPLYHLYHPHLPGYKPPSQDSNSNQATYFLSPHLHSLLTSRSEAILNDFNSGPKLPESIGGYTTLVPLSKPNAPNHLIMGHKTRSFKAWKTGPGFNGSKDNVGFCRVLKRAEGLTPIQEQAIFSLDRWTKIRHPNIVSIHEAFTSKDFGDTSLIVVYDYHPLASTLLETHFSSPRPKSIPEQTLWSYIVQIVCALRVIHSNGLAVGCLGLNTVLVTSQNRVRISGCGIADMLVWDGNKTLDPKDDIIQLGKLIFALAVGNPNLPTNPKNLDLIGRTYSPDLKNAIWYMVTPRRRIDELVQMLAARIAEELEESLIAQDALEIELMRTLENGRIARLLIKMGYINERPEFEHDPRWSDTGERYIIKLFRDWVFHQVDGTDGKPVLDMNHVITALNKLDAGIDERIMLVSRDEQSCIIASFREIKRCIEGAYQELSRPGLVRYS